MTETERKSQDTGLDFADYTRKFKHGKEKQGKSGGIDEIPQYPHQETEQK